LTVVPFDLGHSRDPADVDDQLRLGEPELEKRNEALAARHDLGVIASLGQQPQRLVE
jgi:hypothetical protein